MASHLKWYGDRVKAALLAEMQRRLKAAAILVAGHAKKLLSVAGTGTKKGPGKKSRRVYGANPSAPGEPPRKQTGRLRASVTWEQENITARVGSNVKYARYLELGTRLMQARPWLRRALAECRDAIRAILSAPIQ